MLSFLVNRAPVVWILLCYICGIWVYDQWAFHLPIGSLAVYPFLLLLFLVIGLYRAKKTFSNPSILLNCSAALLVFSVGLLNTGLSDDRQRETWVGHLKKQPQGLLVKIVDRPVEKAKTVLYTVEILSSLYQDTWQNTNGKLSLYLYKQDSFPLFEKGDRLIIPAQLHVIKSQGNLGAFDFAKAQRRRGVYFQQFCSPLAVSQVYLAPQSKSNIIRSQLLAQLDEYIKDSSTLMLSKATMLNAHQGLPDELQDAYARTGISHIIAISGMHVNLLFAIIVLPFFYLPSKFRIIKYLGALPIIWFYIALCDFPPSAIRAGIAFSLAALTLWIKRPQNPLQVWGITGFVMLIVNPMWLFHVGVQLSFLAVLSIILFYPYFRKIFYSKWLIIRLLGEIMALSIAVQVLVFPLVILYFHQFPIWFLFANVLASAFSLIQMVLSAGIMLAGVLSMKAIAMVLGIALTWITINFNAFVFQMNQWSPDLVHLLPLDHLDFLLLMALIVSVALLIKQRTMLRMLVSLISGILLVINWVVQDYQHSKQKGLMVFAGAKQTSFAFVNGRTAVYYQDSVSANLEHFIVKPSALQLRLAEHDYIKATNQLWQWEGKKVLFLNDLSSYPLVGIDILILHQLPYYKVLPIVKRMKAKRIVLDASWTRSKAMKAEQNLIAEGFEVHNTQVVGAFNLFLK